MSFRTNPPSRWNTAARANSRLATFSQQSQSVSLRSMTEQHSSRRIQKRSFALDDIRDSNEFTKVKDPVCDCSHSFYIVLLYKRFIHEQINNLTSGNVQIVCAALQQFSRRLSGLYSSLFTCLCCFLRRTCQSAHKLF